MSKRSATIGVGHEDVIPIQADHTQICRIKDKTNPAYQKIVDICEKLGKEDLPISQGKLFMVYPTRYTSYTFIVLSPQEQQCLDSLAPPSTDKLINRRVSPAKETCKWVLTTQQFITWRKCLPPLLWISGEVGCGKTILMSFLKHQMIEYDFFIEQNKSNVTNRLTVCSFFCDERSKDSANSTAILQSLVYQMVSQHHNLIQHVLKLQSHSPWSYSELWRIFQAMLNDPKLHSVCLIVDALDECHDGRDRLTLLADLCGCFERRLKASGFEINLIVSSRPSAIGYSPELEVSSSYFMLDQDKVLREFLAADIQKFALEYLLSNCQFIARDDPNKMVKFEALAAKIAKLSEGSFQWASLTLEALPREIIGDLESIDIFVSKCPDGLSNIYKKSLASINSSVRKIIVKALRIIVSAMRPLTLMEFKFALVVEKCHTTLEEVQEEIDKGFADILLYLQNNLSTLFWIDEYTITYRHQSVKDFLLNGLSSPQAVRQKQSLGQNSDLSDFNLSMIDANCTLAKCCIDFLNLKDFNRAKNAEDKNQDDWEDAGLGAMSWTPDVTPRSSISVFHGHDDIRGESQNWFFDYAALNWGFIIRQAVLPMTN